MDLGQKAERNRNFVRDRNFLNIGRGNFKIAYRVMMSAFFLFHGKFLVRNNSPMFLQERKNI
jgi:hypothetical protein